MLGYSFLEENADRVTPVSIAGIAPTEATISNLTYPGSRKLYVYVKGEHIAAKPAIKQFIERLCQGVGQGRHTGEAWLGSDRPTPMRPRPRRPGDGSEAARPGNLK